MKDILGFLAFFILSLPLAVLPHRVSLKAGGLLGLLVCCLWRKRRLIAVENLRGAVGRKVLILKEKESVDSLVRENFKNMGRSLAEMIKLYYGMGMGDKIVSDVRVSGVENFERAKEKGKGVILITGHCGNWELLMIAFSAKVGSAGGVARPLDNPYLNRLLERTRQRYRGSVIYKRGALKRILSALKAGGTMGILMDQAVLADEGVVVDFLGAPAWTTRMPAAMAKRTGAAVLPMFISRDGGTHMLMIHPEVELTGDETEDTQRLSNFIADYIRENPSEWLWIHRRWKRTGTACSEH